MIKAGGISDVELSLAMSIKIPKVIGVLEKPAARTMKHNKKNDMRSIDLRPNRLTSSSMESRNAPLVSLFADAIYVVSAAVIFGLSSTD